MDVADDGWAPHARMVSTHAADGHRRLRGARRLVWLGARLVLASSWTSPAWLAAAPLRRGAPQDAPGGALLRLLVAAIVLVGIAFLANVTG